MWPSQETLEALQRELDEHPDVAPDDRVRALAAVAFWKVLALVVAVVAFPVGLFGPALVLIWLVDLGETAAALCGLAGVGLCLALPAASYVTGRALQIRQLRRALHQASDRRDRLVASAGAGGSTSPVAVSASRR